MNKSNFAPTPDATIVKINPNDQVAQDAYAQEVRATQRKLTKAEAIMLAGQGFVIVQILTHEKHCPFNSTYKMEDCDCTLIETFYTMDPEQADAVRDALTAIKRDPNQTDN